MRAQEVHRLVDEVVDGDVIVVGSGVAGLTAALELPGRRVSILTKLDLGGGSSSRWAQGGVAAALGSDDSPRLHAQDTLLSGDGLCHDDTVAILTRQGPTSLRRLMALGGRFDRDAEGDLRLGKEGAHSRRRILHAGGDATGREMVRALVTATRRRPNVAIHEHAFARDLVLADGRVVGVLALHRQGASYRRVFHRAPAVVLATGGSGQLYARTTNPVAATADGLAMAARAGAQLVDLEFVQFHPTALDVDRDPLPLVTEALRGEGSWLIDSSGDRFMVAVHPMAELAPRDVVARAIRRRQEMGHQVFLDTRKAVGEAFARRFPTVYAFCRESGIDPCRQPIPVTPAAHYTMGGIAVDAHGQASLPGLWACGEVASTGVHGANRLASNSLLEALVFGGRVAAAVGGFDAHAVSDAEGEVWRESADGDLDRGSRRAVSSPACDRRRRLRQVMWRDVALERCAEGLERALAELHSLQAEGRVMPWRVSECETSNLLTAGRCVATAALWRQESRGAHLRSDFPRRQGAHGQRAIFVYRPGETGDLVPVTLPRLRQIA